jgi:hypothetical protein
MSWSLGEISQPNLRLERPVTLDEENLFMGTWWSGLLHVIDTV